MHRRGALLRIIGANVIAAAVAVAFWQTAYGCALFPVFLRPFSCSYDGKSYAPQNIEKQR